MELSELIHLLANALYAVDQNHPIHRGYHHGIGPHSEQRQIELAWEYLRRNDNNPVFHYALREVKHKPYPTNNALHCDLVIPDEWAIEVKLMRPFGDNDKVSEHWADKILYPYEGNRSAVADALKLVDSGFNERKAVVLFGYEHINQRRIEAQINNVISAFELILTQIFHINIGVRICETRHGLVHPTTHQILKVYGWEIVGRVI